ncbi:pyridoxamine 5'-phosphate oxidase family protein [Candidatus Bathyarchaeota archaeon]|nr:MAG: pyridoxamine 5'-phosphate oxidase family protein [Candidatus Bathyarchaeota archaeon]
MHPREFVVHLTGLRAIGSGGSLLPSAQRSLSEVPVLRSLFQILAMTSLCSLATVNPDGRSHICHVYFAYSPTLELYFLSDPESRHCTNLETNSSMAVSVFDSTQRWGGMDRGISLYGTCGATYGRDATRSEQVYARRFQAYTKWRATLKSDEETQGLRFFAFAPKRVKVFDEKKLGAGVFVVGSVRRKIRE